MEFYYDREIENEGEMIISSNGRFTEIDFGAILMNYWGNNILTPRD
jgi:hypothetical protein